jgi:small subunit ribosomal protein S16
MAVVLRLKRMGSTNKPFYRVVAADERAATSGRFLETLGWYDPKKAGENFQLDISRVDYWKGAGARMSETVRSLAKKARAKAGAETPAEVK